MMCGVATAADAPAPAAKPDPKLLDVRMIWDAAPHNAFTGLVRFKDRWFIAFREGKAHVSPDGALRIITSADGEKWESAALITSDQGDLRDAKLAITPEGQLMLAGAVALKDPKPVRHLSKVWFSDDGKDWSRGMTVGDENYWLWRVTFHEKLGYGIGYRTVAPRSARLYVTRTDGRIFETLVPDLGPKGWPGEHDFVFQPDGSAVCLLRRDPPPKNEAEGLDAAAKAGLGLVGTSKAPFTQWEWRDVGVRIGGPALLRLPDGRLLATVRLYDGKVRASLCWLDPQSAKLTECLKLPSGGDCSYAGMVLHDGVVLVSYYSSHEGKTKIYLAKVRP
jgi:hypothetical protein